MARATLFLFSSSEGLPFAEFVRAALSGEFDVLLWADPDAFWLSRANIENIDRIATHCDFAIGICTFDDLLRLRKKEFSSHRDNILFELGFFMGRLGRGRTFGIAVGRENEEQRVPSDLDGVGFASCTLRSGVALDQDHGFGAAIRKVVDNIKKSDLYRTKSLPAISIVGGTFSADLSQLEIGIVRSFFFQLICAIDRSGFVVNHCGTDYIMDAAFDFARHHLGNIDAAGLSALRSKICFYWRRGATPGVAYEPPIFSNKRYSDSKSRRLAEIRDSDLVVVIGGRAGTRSFTKDVLWNAEFDEFAQGKPVILVGWFGGAALSIIKECEHKKSNANIILDPDLVKPFTSISDMRPIECADRLIETISKCFRMA